jgi:hypothetical protein
MKRFKNFYIIIILFAIVLICCKKAYNPEVTTINGNYLVVEGLINTGADSTFIKLSRTVIIADKNTAKIETGATVTVESSTNQIYPLLEKLKTGVYGAAPLNLDNTKKYRLRIKTTKGATYLSDFVEAKMSPPIDSIGWTAEANGLQLYANTHDAANNTHYYRWEFAETWEFHSKFASSFMTDGKQVVPRNFITDNIHDCWGNSNSSSIVLGSSIKLTQDVIYRAPLTFVASESEKIGNKYSLLVRQYALTKEAFEFWQLLKKNTENLGSIFDAQPSQLTGNIHNIADQTEPVLGYIGAGTVTQKRIFVPRDQLPNWVTKYPYQCEEPDTVYFVNPITKQRDEDLLFQTRAKIPIDAVYTATGTLVGHTGSSYECSDCTIRGTNKRPAFWQ